MTCIDITAVPVRISRKAAYVEFARRMAEVYRDHGATRVTDYWESSEAADQREFHADGLEYDGDLRGFAALAGATTSEAVVVTIIEWPSKEARHAGNALTTKDPRVLATVDEPPVFDGRRVVASTFEVTMDLS